MPVHKTLRMNIGILGGGQLGRMLALAGIPLGLRFRVLDPGADVPAAVVAEHVRGEYDDFQALYRFCQGLDVVTYEFENVPVETARWLAERVPVYPPPVALDIGQERIAEKTFFARLGIDVPRFASVQTRDDLDQAIGVTGLPAVLKTTRFGYDGKGQTVIRNAAEVETAWNKLGGRPLILEEMIPFDRELSILSVRGRTGQIVTYPLVENHHRDGILRRSIAPATRISSAVQSKANEIARRCLEELGYVGVLAIELFQVGDRLIVNEMAPRVHNSGHWTIEGAQTSQFENHVRAVAGLPLGATSVDRPSVMFNLIGNWPEPAEILSCAGAHLHLYGKDPRPNRKVGHITICGDSMDQSVSEVRKLIEDSDSSGD